jgi:hypothetical protein
LEDDAAELAAEAALEDVSETTIVSPAAIVTSSGAES